MSVYHADDSPDDRMSGSADVPVEFLAAVKDALDHLYDLERLNHHPLERWLIREAPRKGTSPAQALRQRLLDGIERVKPDGRVSPAAPQHRAYHLLELRFVEAMPFREAMRTLALSQSQYHREQRRAVLALATLLWESRGDGETTPRAGEAGRAVPGQGELNDLAASLGDDAVGLETLLREVAELLEPVASMWNCALRVAPADRRVLVRTSRTALRQAVIDVIEWMLAGVSGGVVTLAGEQLESTAEITVERAALAGRDPAQEASIPSGPKLDQAWRLVSALGGEMHTTLDDSECARATLRLPARRVKVLVIDDNPDMIQMIARFLADQPYTVSGATSVDEGIATARRSRPDLILLDVMMPHRDGWDALQSLRHHPATIDLPVVVCTILDERSLAAALGAAAFIRKPLTRAALLRALDQALSLQSQQSPVGAGHRGGPAPPAASG